MTFVLHYILAVVSRSRFLSSYDDVGARTFLPDEHRGGHLSCPSRQKIAKTSVFVNHDPTPLDLVPTSFFLVLRDGRRRVRDQGRSIILADVRGTLLIFW